MNMKHKNPLRTDGFASFSSSLMAILVGLAVGLVVLLVSNPSQAFKGFSMMLAGGFSDMKNFGQVLYFATPIILTGLSVGFANKTGLFNIGTPGQFIVGAYVAVLIGVKCQFTGAWVVALLAAMLAGAVWGLLPGFLKAFCNVNEVITCIMMNYIGMYAVNFMVKKTIYDSLKNQSLKVAETGIIPKLGMDKVFVSGASPSSANIGIFIAIVVGILIYILLNKTKFGYELKACGYNASASKYAGINEKRNIVASMAIAGALAALGGALLYLAGAGKHIEVLDILSPEGFNGIPVALLGLSNPIGIIFSGIFVAYLNVGGFNMQVYDFVPQVIEIIIAVIIYFSAFALVFKGVILSIGKKHSNGDNANADLTMTPDDSQSAGTLPLDGTSQEELQKNIQETEKGTEKETEGQMQSPSKDDKGGNE